MILHLTHVWATCFCVHITFYYRSFRDRQNPPPPPAPSLLLPAPSHPHARHDLCATNHLHPLFCSQLDRLGHGGRVHHAGRPVRYSAGQLLPPSPLRSKHTAPTPDICTCAALLCCFTRCVCCVCLGSGMCSFDSPVLTGTV